MKKVLSFILVTTILLLIPLQVRANEYRTRDYNYNFWLKPVPSTPGYRLEKIVNVASLPGVFNYQESTDIHVGKDKIYIVDTAGSQVIVTDHDFNFIYRIRTFIDENKVFIRENGVQVTLTNPEGVFEAPNGDLYVADTGYRGGPDGSSRIIVFSPKTHTDGSFFYYVKNIIYKPENYMGKTNFLPSKLVVDNAYRIYVIVQGGNEGIVVLNNDGSFSRFFGTNEIRINPIDYFWKKLASKEQKQKMNLTFAPPFNNIDVDRNGFIYATNSDSSTIYKVVRLNPSGVNVIRQEGYTLPIGDIATARDESRSNFIAVSVNDYGMYLVLDSSKGKIFLYNFDGELLFIISGMGNIEGRTILPADVSWLGDKILVTDKTTGYVLVFTPTEFGKLVIGATKDYFAGKWDAAGEQWKKAIEFNANYELAYVGYGKMLYMNGDYKEAAEYFKLGNNKNYYSLAYKKYRAEYMQEHFLLFLTPMILLAGLVIYSEVQYNRKRG